MLQRRAEKSRSQAAGSLTNADGVHTVSGNGTSRALRLPNRPMSWYRGSQLAPRSSGVMLTPPEIAAHPWSTLAWVSRTPLGNEVLPDVNWTTDRSSGATAGRGMAAGPASACPDSACLDSAAAGRNSTCGATAQMRRAVASLRAPTTTRRIPAAAMMAVMRAA